MNNIDPIGAVLRAVVIFLGIFALIVLLYVGALMWFEN